MKRMFVLGASLMVCLFSLSGCNRSSALSPRKNETQEVVLSGYSGIPGNSGLAVSGALYGESPSVEPGSTLAVNNPGSGSRTVTVDSQYQANQGFLEIKEKMFIAQINDVYLNPEDYIGKTIKLEGIFQTQEYLSNSSPYYFVIRYGPGCCGSDGNAGFEVMWDAKDTPYPNENDWVEAVGILGSYEEDGYPYLCLSLSSLKALETRGAEFVTQ